MVNLDRIAAEASQTILNTVSIEAKIQAKNLERLTTNSLGVLQEQGLYAFFLYLLSRGGIETDENKLEPDEMAACVLTAQLLGLLNRTDLKGLNLFFSDKDWVQNPGQVNSDSNKRKLLEHVSGPVVEDLRRLLLVKALFEKVLIYTRYGTRAINLSAAEGS